MGWWSSVKSYVSSKISRPAPTPAPSAPAPTTTTTSSTPTTSTSSSTPTFSSGSSTVAQVELDPVRSVDYVTSSGASAGATTTSGTDVWTSGGGTVTSTTFSPEVTKSLTGGAVTEDTKVLAPQDTRITVGEPLVRLRAKETAKDEAIWKEVAPKTFLGKAGMGLKTLYFATPFGTSIVAPEEYHCLRETGLSKWISGLTLTESAGGLKAQKIKEYKAGQQQSEWLKFTSGVEKAPEDKKYKVYEAGRTALYKKGIKTT